MKYCRSERGLKGGIDGCVRLGIVRLSNLHESSGFCDLHVLVKSLFPLFPSGSCFACFCELLFLFFFSFGSESVLHVSDFVSLFMCWFSMFFDMQPRCQELQQHKLRRAGNMCRHIRRKGPINTYREMGKEGLKTIPNSTCEIKLERT